MSAEIVHVLICHFQHDFHDEMIIFWQFFLIFWLIFIGLGEWNFQLQMYTFLVAWASQLSAHYQWNQNYVYVEPF